MSIWTAVEKEDIAAIGRYASSGGDLETGAWLHKQTPLFYALKQQKRKSYEKLLSLGASPNKICRGGAVVIHHAAAEKDSWWLRMALEHGGDPNLMNDVAEGFQHDRPLTFATGTGTPENTKLLVEHGAEINYVNQYWETPLTRAWDVSAYDVVLYLLDQGADYNLPEPTSLIGCMNRHGRRFNFSDADLNKYGYAVFDWFSKQGLEIETAKFNGKTWEFEEKK